MQTMRHAGCAKRRRISGTEHSIDAPARGGCVRSEVDARVLEITIDNPRQRNAFSPEMMRQLSDSLTHLDAAPELWAGVLCADGDHFTGRPRYTEILRANATATPMPPGNVDPFGLPNDAPRPSSRPCRESPTQWGSK